MLGVRKEIVYQRRGLVSKPILQAIFNSPAQVIL